MKECVEPYASRYLEVRFWHWDHLMHMYACMYVCRKMLMYTKVRVHICIMGYLEEQLWHWDPAYPLLRVPVI